MDKVNLLDYRRDVYTSTGNDGITEYIFKTIGVETGIFVEFGAWDGVRGCNCRKLFEQGWSGVFIEADDEKYANLCKNYEGQNRVHCCKAMVGFEDGSLFDRIVDPFLKGANIDFCLIDIDGLDLEVFETFEKYLPTVVCIEGGQMLDPLHERLDTAVASKNIQQSLSVMVESFEKKGYKVLCSYQDTYFIRAEFYDRFNVASDLYELYFNGLAAIPKRIPYIQKKLKDAGLKNPIVNDILWKSGFWRYGYRKRKLWAEKQSPKIQAVIKEKYERTKSTVK